MKLLELAAAKEKVEVYVGWSDGIAEPKLTGSDIELPERSNLVEVLKQYCEKACQCLL